MDNGQETRNFKSRLDQQNFEDSKSRNQGKENSGAYWGYATGDYSKPIFQSDYGTPTLAGIDRNLYKKGGNEKLVGIEESIGKMIVELLKKSDKRPILILDYGGGIGMSWCRLAKEFEEEIKQGNIVFVVTNQEQNFDIDKALEANYSHPSQSEDKELIKYVIKNKLLTYIEVEPTGSDTPEIKSLRQYRLDNGGKSVPLIGSVDIINCRMSLVHSLIPEIHYPRVFELLSDNGVFIDTSFSAETPAPPSSEIDKGSLINSQIRKPVFDAYQNVITSFGMKPIVTIENGPRAGKKMFATVLRKNDSDFPSIWA